MTDETERSKSPKPPYEYEARFIENENPSSVFVRTHRPLLDPEEVPGGVSHEIIIEYDDRRFRVLRVVERAEPPTASELRKIGVLEVEPLTLANTPSQKNL